MNFRLLYRDEFAGFARSKVMMLLWIGLPLLTMILRFAQPNTGEIPLVLFIALLMSSIAGTLSAVLLATTVTSERNRGVYDLFLVRRATRSELLLAKFFASFTALFAAVILSVLLGVVVEAVTGSLSADVARRSGESLVVSIAGMAVACSVGLLLGTVFDSVALSAIFAVYLGNQLSGLIVLPAVLIESVDPLLYGAAAGTILPFIILSVALRVFNGKSL